MIQGALDWKLTTRSATPFPLQFYLLVSTQQPNLRCAAAQLHYTVTTTPLATNRLSMYSAGDHNRKLTTADPTAEHMDLKDLDP